MGILSFLLSLINPLSAITKQIVNAKVEMANAQNDYERLKTEETIKQLESRRDVLINNPLSRWVQALWAAPFILYEWKVVFYDKALGEWTQSRTDPLGPFETNIGMIIVSFYFLTLGVNAWRRR